MASSNTVTITSSLIESISYIDNSLVITQGESSSPPPSIVQDASKWIITLQADRSGSENVADTFNTRVGGASHEYAPTGGGTGKMPDKLNFYFGITITFNIGGTRVSTDVYLAQGHYLLTNNWWMGAGALVNIGTPMLLAISNNVVRQVFTLSGGTSDFTLKDVS